MKIKVTIERECCHPDDMVTYHGVSDFNPVLYPKFCKHCGQIWIRESFMDAAGARDWEYVKAIPREIQVSKPPRNT